MEHFLDLQRLYQVSEIHGFLLDDPLERLPEYFNLWNYAAKQMSSLVAEKGMRDFVDKMPMLDYTRLASTKEYRLAHLQLSIIASGYIWQEGEKGVKHDIPECLAAPWYNVSQILGIKPVISHCSLALANWRWSEKERCIESLYQLPGNDEADWFTSVTSQVEMDFGPAIPHILGAVHNAEQGSIEELIHNLRSLTAILEKMKETLSTMHDRLSARTFYNVIRPFLSGWGGEGSPLPDGLLYTGVDKEPKQMIGASAAQSSTLQSMDALLGVVHETETQTFLLEMRNYMIPAHREFICWIENRSTVKTLVIKQCCARLSSCFEACVKSVVDFRSYHIQIVTKYIVMMADKSKDTNDFESLSTKGTGGSDLLPFLKTLRSSTSDTIPSSKKSEDNS